jgi:hypothetical protein
MADDTVNAKWEQLQEMRKKNAPRDPETGKFVKDETPPVDDTAALAAAKAEADAAIAAQAAEAEKAKAAEPAKVEPPAVTPPTSEEIEIDGQKISVDPSLAAAFKKAESIKTESIKVDERAALKAELAAELRAELAPKPKTEAELAAEKALADAQAKLNEPKMPEAKLMIDDPEEYNRRMQAYVDTVAKNARDSAKAEFSAEQAKTRQVNEVSERERARAVLNVQFYDQYPILKDSKLIVDRILEDQFNAVFASGKIAALKTVEEGEALKKSEFADAAAKATKEIVKLMAAGKRVAPPPPPPPTLAASAPAKSPAPPKQDTEKTTKERFPKGSVSASLAEVRARKMAASG